MRFPFAILIVCILALGVLGQSWHKFEALSDGFSVSTPFPLSQQGETTGRGGRKYFGQGSGVWLYVFTDDPRDTSQTDTIAKFFSTQGQKLTFSESEDPFRFKDEFGYWHTIVAVKSRARLYLAEAVTADDDSAIPDHFAHTFKINRSWVPQIIESSNTDRPEQADTQIPIQNRTAQGFGSGNGTNGGFGIGAGTGITPLPPPSGTHGIKLLSKPRPTYTDLARLYEISGTIRMRITFLDNGSIGNVEALSSLPFGLDRQAMSAAKRMTFEPATKDGVPYTVTKQVEYTFSIY